MLNLIYTIIGFFNMLRWKLAFYYLNMKEYRWLGKHLLSKKERTNIRICINKIKSIRTDKNE